ncbi:MAG: thrombospondin type 3 repeat-containing protein [Gammaproteobacteria bacterium]
MSNRCTLLLTLTLITLWVPMLANAQTMSSSNYEIQWDTNASGGLSLSSSYTLRDAALQSTPPGLSLSASFSLTGGFHSPPDDDADSLRNFVDNCTQIANEDQRDTNGDGFGNACDADLNNDGVINVVDLGLLRSVFFTADADADLNGDGVVNVVDLGLLRAAFFSAPGPSGLN